MEQSKAPEVPLSEDWASVPWRKLEQHLYRLQKRIFKASQQGDVKTVQKLQQLLMKSRSARLLAVRRVTQDNQGKKTAGIDGVKSINPNQRMDLVEAIHPRFCYHRTPQPLRRVWIPKPGKTEKRPLGIPVMYDRASQALVKQAMEPQWEAKFEANSYGFRPGRSAHDAIGAIFNCIRTQSKLVLDADIKGCFDNINHQALLAKLATYPAIRRLIKGWLKAGVMEGLELTPTTAGTPQGGVISPLLANIALYGMEEAMTTAYLSETHRRSRRYAPYLIRYADDFVILHQEEKEIIRAQRVVAEWLASMGLELKPSKTRLSHTLLDYQGNQGFAFLGFSIRQFFVGKTQTRVHHQGKPLGFKTIITPSTTNIQRHMQNIRSVLRKSQSFPQEKLIAQLNPIIQGWAMYYRTVAASKSFAKCDQQLMRMLWRRMIRRHPHKGARWVKNKYWRTIAGKSWTYATPEGPKERRLRQHADTAIKRHVKVKGDASPFDGNLLYWAKRLKDHPLTTTKLGRLLQRQYGKCRWCSLLFREHDHIEIDHIIPRSMGGRDDSSNYMALHGHCHDQKHAIAGGIHVN